MSNSQPIHAVHFLRSPSDVTTLFLHASLTGIHTSTELHVAHFHARRSCKHAVCVGTVHDRAQGRPVMQGPAACVSLLGSATPWL